MNALRSRSLNIAWGVIGVVLFFPLLAFADVATGAGDDPLLLALLRAIEDGHWWAALAATGALTIAVLRRRGLIRLRWLASAASIVLAVAGGVLHYWMAGAPWDVGMLGTALRIALPMVLATLIPEAEPAPDGSPALVERS